MSTVKDATDAYTQLAHAVSQADADYAARHRTLSVRLSSAIGVDGLRSFFYCDKKVRIKSAKILPMLALTVDGTNYDEYDFGYNDGAGGALTKLSNGFTTKNANIVGPPAYTSTGSWVVGTAIALAGLTDNSTVDAGKYLCLQSAKQGNGIAWDMVLHVELEYV